MIMILKREIKSYLKNPLFWIGIAVLFIGVFQAVSPYLSTRYLKPDEKIINDFPETVHEGEVYEGYVPSTEEQRRKIWEKEIQSVLISEFQMDENTTESIIHEIKDMDVLSACKYLEKKYDYLWAVDYYEDTAYHKGTNDEINSYIAKKLENKTFSYYFSRKFADFSGLFMGFFAAIILSMLFMIYAEYKKKHI